MEQSTKIISNPSSLLVKLGIAALAVWFIVHRVVGREEAGKLWQDVVSITRQEHTFWILPLVLGLMILNWSLEAVKWKRMMRKSEIIPFRRSLEAVCSGLTVSLFTPNRIGEYAGRVFHLQIADRIEATLITVIENLGQLFVTLITGSVALFIYLWLYVPMPPYLFAASGILLFAFGAALLVMYLNVNILEILLKKLPLPVSWKQYLPVFSRFTPEELQLNLFLSLIRYLVFTLQFCLLADLFGLELSYFQVLVLIAVTYFTMTIIPVIAITELGVKGAVSTYFFSFATDNLIPVLNAGFALWIINLAIPALAGAVLVFGFRFRRRFA